MIKNWGVSFDHVLASEGGYSNDPVDPGGETNLGVTKRAWAEFIKRPVADGEMKTLTKDMVRPFYKTMYWDKCDCDNLPSGYDYMVFDFAVNAGVSRSNGFKKPTQGIDTKILIEAFSKAKTDFYNGIVQRRPSQIKFLKGWLNRVASVEKFALSMN